MGQAVPRTWRCAIGCRAVDLCTGKRGRWPFAKDLRSRILNHTSSVALVWWTDRVGCGAGEMHVPGKFFIHCGGDGAISLSDASDVGC